MFIASRVVIWGGWGNVAGWISPLVVFALRTAGYTNVVWCADQIPISAHVVSSRFPEAVLRETLL